MSAKKVTTEPQKYSPLHSVVQHPINPLVTEHLARFSKSPTHAILLLGTLGMGHIQATQHLIAGLDQSSTPVIMHVTAQEKQHISIDAVRELRTTLKHKSTMQQGFATIVIIDSIDAMLGEAQNALLKLLEEPPSGVLFILYGYAPLAILPTVQSRCAVVRLLPVSIEQAKNYFGESFNTSAYHVSGGSPELLAALHTQTDHPLTSAIAQAKGILASPVFERLCQIDALTKQKEQAILLIDALYRLCSAGLQSSAQKDAWLKRLRYVIAAKQRMDYNVQLKLVLSELFLCL